MKKTKKTIETAAGGTYRICCNYAPEVLAPNEAIERSFYDTARPWTDDKFVTLDGKICRPEFVMSWGEVSDEKMDDFCEEHFGLRFSTIRSLWFERLSVRYGLDRWHYIRLYELE